MRWLLAAALLIPCGVRAQGVRLGAAELPAAELDALPDSPGATLYPAGQAVQVTLGQSPTQPCTKAARLPVSDPEAMSAAEAQMPCLVDRHPYRLFLDNTDPTPLTVRQKGYLAFHDVIDPFNILTIVAQSAISVGADAHSAYGPGFRGFGINVGDSFLQDATGEVIGTFAVCSLFHEDPRYHRLPSGTPLRRLGHAIAHTVVSQHDDGTPMVNFENLIVYPASAEISNLYVPGVHGNGPSTVERIVTGLATEPIGNIITEFLPEFAKHVHVRVIFVQQIINQIASGQTL